MWLWNMGINKIWRSHFGSLWKENSESHFWTYKWQRSIKYNNELYTLYKESDIVTYIKINQLKWAGHVICMEEQSPTRRVLVAVVEGRRQRGRPKLRWEDGGTEDARKLGESNWRNAARNRDSWQKLLKKALAQKGLLCQWWWWLLTGKSFFFVINVHTKL